MNKSFTFLNKILCLKSFTSFLDPESTPSLSMEVQIMHKGSTDIMILKTDIPGEQLSGNGRDKDQVALIQQQTITQQY